MRALGATDRYCLADLECKNMSTIPRLYGLVKQCFTCITDV